MQHSRIRSSTARMEGKGVLTRSSDFVPVVSTVRPRSQLPHHVRAEEAADPNLAPATSPMCPRVRMRQQQEREGEKEAATSTWVREEEERRATVGAWVRGRGGDGGRRQVREGEEEAAGFTRVEGKSFPRFESGDEEKFGTLALEQRYTLVLNFRSGFSPRMDPRSIKRSWQPSKCVLGRCC